MEWRLYPEGRPPYWTTPAFFQHSPHIPPASQRGHAQRQALVVRLVRDVTTLQGLRTVTDLGCGDGSLLVALQPLNLRCWGYDVSTANLAVARRKGVRALYGDILDPGGLGELGQLLVATEVVEHLADPHRWLARLGGHHLVLSSPWDEHPGNAYEHHAWAWDEPGYRDLAEGAGWRVVEQRAAPAGFQALYCTRPADG